LGNIRGNDDRVPPKEWIIEICDYIKSIDNNHLILDGADEALWKSDNLNIKNLDIHSSHFYSEDTNRMNNDANKSMSINRPYIVGEYSPHFNDSWFRAIENNKNIKGSFWWSLFPINITHNDGYAIYWKKEEDHSKLLKLTNHACRMRGLPIVTKLW
jgi:mannan endo-1,4-beta-mannosidase